MASNGGALVRILTWILPSRASTQRWMILTFVLFTGIAVVSVILYMGVVVRQEVDSTLRRSVVSRAARIAEDIERISDPADRRRFVRDLARQGDYRITFMDEQSGTFDVQGTQMVSDGSLATRPEMVALQAGDIGYAHRPENGVTMLFGVVRRPGTGLVVRVGMEEPAITLLVRRLQWTIVAAMLVTLMLAIVGAWIAARRVTEPLEAIRASARRISDGQFDQAIVVDSRASEFQDLASSLNRMSDTFRDKISHLQRLAALQNEFLGNVSHEVRNPIFAVGGYLEALASASLTGEQRRFYAEKGLANLERLNNLFNDLIEIARLEYREDLIKQDNFDLNELVDEVSEMLRQKAEEKGLEFVTDNHEVYVYADRNRVRQVLVNLVDNAIAYSDEGSVRCRFRRHLSKVRIEVVDTGRGIPEEHLERVFERFYRIDPDRSRKSGGTGLGLSIVRQILHAHGETIHVESTVGRSTRFWFELPLSNDGSAPA